MNQATHAWIAIRAIALLEDEGKMPYLVKLLKPCARQAAIGAWIPDQADARHLGSGIDCHVLKMQPAKAMGDRFIASKSDLVKRLGSGRKMAELLKADTSLTDAWWKTPYRGDVMKPGQHVANRAMALATAIADLLVLGDPEVDALVPGDVAFVGEVAAKAKTSCEQAALCFSMLSHFVADACMPCHCDKRALSKYKDGFLHQQLEKHWSELIGKGYDDSELENSQATPDGLLAQARAVDGKVGIQFAKSIPQMKSDVWMDMINVCRAAFAIASIMAPPSKYAYGSAAMVTLPKLLDNGQDGQLSSIDKAVLHDAVLNTAMVWKSIWPPSSRIAKQRA